MKNVMADLPVPFRETLRRVVHGTIEARSKAEPQFGTEFIAQQLGVGQRMFQHYMEAEDGRRCPAQMIPELCRTLGNYEILDALESAAGRVAFRPDDYAQLDPHDIRAAHGLLREVGEALGKLADTLRDDVVEKSELQETARELDDVIRECAALKYWLQRRQQSGSSAHQPRRRP